MQAPHPRVAVASAPAWRLDSAAEAAEVSPVQNPETTSRAVPEFHFARTELKTFPSYLPRIIHLYEKEKPVSSSLWPVFSEFVVHREPIRLNYSTLHVFVA